MRLRLEPATRKTRAHPANPGPLPCPSCRSVVDVIGVTDPLTSEKALIWSCAVCMVDFHRWPKGNTLRRAAEEWAERKGAPVREPLRPYSQERFAR